MMMMMMMMMTMMMMMMMMINERTSEKRYIRGSAKCKKIREEYPKNILLLDTIYVLASFSAEIVCVCNV